MHRSRPILPACGCRKLWDPGHSRATGPATNVATDRVVAAIERRDRAAPVHTGEPDGGK